LPALAYAAVGVGIAMAAGSMIWLSSLNPDTNPSASIVPEIQKVQTSEKASVQGLSNSPSEIARGTATQKQNATEQALNLNFFVVAGSFKNFQIADEAGKEWNGNGFQTSFHKAEDKGMMRVAIGQFQSKEDALAFLSKSQSSFNSQLWILKEEKAN
jgi:cell division protein FtsN